MQKRILLVYTRGGAPLEYALPRIAARGQVHILALQPLPAKTERLWRPHCAAVIPAHGRLGGEALVAEIVRQATAVRADAVMSLSESAVVPVAQAAERLGLRGAGQNAARSRDKRMMRAAWKAAGVPIPRFRPVASEDSLRAAFRELTPPLLLKCAWGWNSVGHLIIDCEERIGQAWAQIRATIAAADSAGLIPLYDAGAPEDFLAEEIIPGTTRSWYAEGSGLGDHLSVEGIVVDGVYHPICITSRLPTIPPFTEMGNVAPCVLPEHLQRTIESAATAAVDALDLRTCGTHTEIKLMDGRRLALIESAARFGGVMITAQIQHVFGYDLIGLLTDALLGQPITLPERMLTAGAARGAAGSIPLISCDSAGTPWSRDLVWDESRVDWASMLSPGTHATAVPGFTVPAGTTIPRHDPGNGAAGRGGTFFMRADTADTLVRDAHTLLDNMERVLANGWGYPGDVLKPAS